MTFHEFQRMSNGSRAQRFWQKIGTRIQGDEITNWKMCSGTCCNLLGLVGCFLRFLFALFVGHFYLPEQQRAVIPRPQASDMKMRQIRLDDMWLPIVTKMFNDFL